MLRTATAHSPPNCRQVLACARLEVVRALDFRNGINLGLESLEKIGLPGGLGLHLNGAREHRGRDLLCCLFHNQTGGAKRVRAAFHGRTEPHSLKGVFMYEEQGSTLALSMGYLRPQVSETRLRAQTSVALAQRCP